MGRVDFNKFFIRCAPAALTIIFMLILILMSASTGFAMESGAYVPDYRLKFVSGAENTLGRPLLDTSPHPWDGRISSDYADRTLPISWRESSWSVRLGSSFGSLHYHVDLRVDENGEILRDIIDPRHTDYLNRIRTIYGTRITLSLIGEEDVFGPISQDPELRSAFVESLLSLCVQYNLSGVDLDWEFVTAPRPAIRKAYTQLAKTIYESFKPLEKELSVAVSRWRPLDQELFDYVDKVHLMAYDGYGRHSTFEAAISDAENFVSRYGVDRQKVILGLPYYGRIWDPSQEEYWIGTRNYRDIVSEWGPKPDEDEAGFFYFNGPDTISRKTSWALQNSFGGVYVWEPFYDIRGNASLTSVITSVIRDSIN